MCSGQPQPKVQTAGKAQRRAGETCVEERARTGEMRGQAESLMDMETERVCSGRTKGRRDGDRWKRGKQG